MAKETVRTRLAEYLRQQALEQVTEADWTAIRSEFLPVSPGYLRRLLRDSGLPLAPLVEGVRQSSLAALERTLLALEQEYTHAQTQNLPDRATTVRQVVIEARNQARWALARTTDPNRLTTKQEQLTWLQTWLENPPAFPPWLVLRKSTRG